MTYYASLFSSPVDYFGGGGVATCISLLSCKVLYLWVPNYIQTGRCIWVQHNQLPTTFVYSSSFVHSVYLSS